MKNSERKITIPVSIGYGLTDIMGVAHLPSLAHGYYFITQLLLVSHHYKRLPSWQ